MNIYTIRIEPITDPDATIYKVNVDSKNPETNEELKQIVSVLERMITDNK